MLQLLLLLMLLQLCPCTRRYRDVFDIYVAVSVAKYASRVAQLFAL